mmetsp:Transcript_27546/g.48683  ORF Transcript_27546/g.48683 Transcript_27546/m.48683 type:complete len:344 (-) Transcript_27546:688-1719(-)
MTVCLRGLGVRRLRVVAEAQAHLVALVRDLFQHRHPNRDLPPGERELRVPDFLEVGHILGLDLDLAEHLHRNVVHDLDVLEPRIDPQLLHNLGLDADPDELGGCFLLGVPIVLEIFLEFRVAQRLLEVLPANPSLSSLVHVSDNFVDVLGLQLHSQPLQAAVELGAHQNSVVVRIKGPESVQQAHSVDSDQEAHGREDGALSQQDVLVPSGEDRRNRRSLPVLLRAPPHRPNFLPPGLAGLNLVDLHAGQQQRHLRVLIIQVRIEELKHLPGLARLVRIRLHIAACGIDESVAYPQRDLRSFSINQRPSFAEVDAAPQRLSFAQRRGDEEAAVLHFVEVVGAN